MTDKKIAFERATDLAASQLAFFLRGNGDERLEPNENEKLLAGHIVGSLWANDLLNTGDEKWEPIEHEVPKHPAWRSGKDPDANA